MDTPLLTATYYGDSGGSTTYYYWVQGIYPWGFGPLSNAASVTVLSLGHNNVVSLNWSTLPGVTYVNVYRSSSATPPTGTSGLGIQKALATADGLVDNGLPNFSIIVGAAGPALMRTQAEIDAENKKIGQEAKAENDKLLKELEEDTKKAEAKDAEDEEQARKLNLLYNERYQLPVRPTAAQEAVMEEQRKEGKRDEKEVVKNPTPHPAPVPNVKSQPPTLADVKK